MREGLGHIQLHTNTYIGDLNDESKVETEMETGLT